jgi:hypothetical protein
MWRNMVSVRFPKEHEAFLKDGRFRRNIKQLEDRIEQMYQSLELLRSLDGIVQIVESHAKPPTARMETPPELLQAMEEILSQAPPPDQLDIDRDAIWEMKARAGTQYVLGFLSPALLMTMEMLFSGIVVQYIQMFNGSRRRAPLRCGSVFAADDEGLALHLEIDEIRNKNYAHKEAAAGQHHLSYYIGENLELNVDKGGPHESIDFHLTLYHDLKRNLHKVLGYLRKEIDVRSENLLSGLSDEQRLALLQHWDSAAQRGLTTPVPHAIINRREM